MAYVKSSFRDPDLQNAYMWKDSSFESVLETIRHRSITPVLSRHLAPNSLVLEAGCGNGAWLRWLTDVGHRAVGIDNNLRIITDGKGRRLWLVENDVLRKCFGDATFDACLSLGVIEHFPEGPQAPLAELRRVLKPGGLLFVSTPCNNLFRKLVNHPLRDLLNLAYRLRGRTLHFVEYRFERRELVEKVRAAGFEILETVPNDYRLDQNERSIGFYTDWPIFRANGEKWRLNGPGRIVFRALKAVSPYWVVSGILVVARKPVAS